MNINPSAYKTTCKEIRRHILRMHAKSNSSHIGSSLSCVEILACLFFDVMKINPQNPNDENRDRFILSKGHAVSALYAVLAKRGFFGESLLDEYCTNGGRLPGHATKGTVPGIEASTGSLGHGLAMGIGMAIAAKQDQRLSRIFVVVGDGECNEGSVWEGAMFASHHKLDNLVVIVDCNGFQAFGKTDDIVKLEPLADKWGSFGWSVKQIDGHRCEQIIKTLGGAPFEKSKPSIIIANTIKGKGVSFMENKLAWHYKSPNPEELKAALKELDLP